jgi:UDP-GlcNAc:undecaprenyl-phosphate/decaprenyl-phosphate GlcNAc-1-phosphate transferase
MYYLIILIQFLLTFFFLKAFIKFGHKINNYGESNTHVIRNENVPTGGGIIVFFIYLISFFFYFLFYKEKILELLPNKYYILIFSIIVLFIISAYDDFSAIHPIYKLILQIILVYISTVTLDLNNTKLPLKLLLLIIVVFWVYIINIVNFIDGSDGFLTSYSLFFFTSILTENFIKSNSTSLSTFFALLLIPILVIFLYFNKPTAKIFIGDSGSIFLGFLIGYISLNKILAYDWKLSIILLMYPLLDCTITLIIKIKNGYYPWARLFDYFFLGPIKKNNNHSLVFKTIIFYLVLNFIIFVGQLFFINSIIFILLSFLLTVSTLLYFKKNS